MDTSICLDTIFSIIIIIQMTLILVFFFRLFHQGAFQFFIKEGLSNPTNDKINRATEKTQEKYMGYGLSKELVEDFKVKLIHIIEDEKTYLNPNLKLSDVAKKIGLSNNQTSQVINQSFEKDFNSFINEFRIREAAYLLQQDQNTTVIEIIYQVGFNNKVTFNKAFKKYYKCTPKEYMRKHFHLD
ncbi:MAG: helix-turn-helix domain-containing protein [Bacteroidota bacterium]